MIRPRSFAAAFGLLFVGVLCLFQAQAQMGPLTGANTPFTKTNRGGCAYNTSTCAWVSAVTTAGGSVSATQGGRVDSLIVAAKANSWFSTNSRVWLHLGESDPFQATIDIMGLATAVNNGSTPLSASGYTGNGSSRYIDYGAIPSDFVQDSATYGICNVLSSTTDNTTVAMGVNGGGTLSDLFPKFDPLQGAARINSGGGDLFTYAKLNRIGMQLAVRTGANAAAAYVNGVLAITDAGSSTSIAGWTGGFFGLARNDDGTASSHSVDVLGIIYIGPGGNATRIGNISTDLDAYAVAWGINACH